MCRNADLDFGDDHDVVGEGQGPDGAEGIEDFVRLVTGQEVGVRPVVPPCQQVQDVGVDTDSVRLLSPLLPNQRRALCSISKLIHI